MNLLVLRSLWGLTGTFKQELEYVDNVGYGGI